MCIKIILADDHELVRAALRALLEKELGAEVLAEAGDGETVVQQVRELGPDVVVMDVTMPGLDGICATRKITEEFPSTKVIALSMHGNKLFVEDMFKAGASAYLLKASASEELSNAIHAVMAGEMYVSSKIAGVIIDNGKAHLPSPSNSTAVLTRRECQVLQLIAGGKATKEIALHLNKSVQTVDACRRHIMEKLDIGSVADMVKYAIREGLTSVEPRRPSGV